MLNQPTTYSAGTLSYTRRTLTLLFFWLLWGDCCYVLMESVVPSVMPLQFKGLGASNTLIAMLMSTIPAIMSTVLNPVISFKSDRFRSRWGRRIPFILCTLPFLVICLVGLGFGKQIAEWGYGRWGSFWPGLKPQTAAIIVLGAMMVAFSFFNLFVNSVFWYLFNDVVPERLLARFMSLFRMVSTASGSLYSFCVFQYGATHSTEILVGAGLLYFFGFGLMCLNVKEGKYPPPPDTSEASAFAALAGVKTFAKECHYAGIYLFQYLAATSTALANGVWVFMLFFYQSTGLSLAQVGKIHGTAGAVSFALIYFSGSLADRFHPIRIVMVGLMMQCFLVFPASMVWLFWHPSPDVAFWVWMAIVIGLSAPAGVLVSMSDPPMLMRIFSTLR